MNSGVVRRSASIAFATGSLLWVLLAAGCAAPPGPSESEPDTTTDHLHPPVEFRTVSEFFKLSPGAELAVTNDWGDVRVRQHEVGAAEVVAAIQRIGTDPPSPPTVRSAPDGSARALRVEFPGARIEPRRNGRVDLMVYLPAGVPLRVATRDGLIEAKKTANPLTLRSGSGDIIVINDARIDARSDTGRVHGRPVGPGFGRMRLQSAGPVDAFVPVPSSFELLARGTDDVEGEWPMTRVEDGYRIDEAGSASDVDRIELVSSDRIRVYRSAVEPADASAIRREPSR